MELASDKWEPAEPIALRMLAHELATGAEAVYHLCERARQGEDVEGGRPPHRRSLTSPRCSPLRVGNPRGREL
jgi:hypothetical protein